MFTRGAYATPLARCFVFFNSNHISMRYKGGLHLASVGRKAPE